MYYYYKSKVGTFKIVPRQGRFVLVIGDTTLDSYPSAKSAADDVYTQSTGYDKWDGLPFVTEPTDLSEWPLVP